MSAPEAPDSMPHFEFLPLADQPTNFVDFCWSQQRELHGVAAVRGVGGPGSFSVRSRSTAAGLSTILVCANAPVTIRAEKSYHLPASAVWLIQSPATYEVDLDETADIMALSACTRGRRALDRPGDFNIGDSPGGPLLVAMNDLAHIRFLMRGFPPIWADTHNHAAGDLTRWEPAATQPFRPADDHRTVLEWHQAATLFLTYALSLAKRAPAFDGRPASYRQRCDQFIDQNLSDRKLNADSIATHFFISRRYVENLYRGDGGVARYIRGLRLDQVLALADRDEYSVTDLREFGLASGFGSTRSLERAVHEHTGSSLTEIVGKIAKNTRVDGRGQYR